ncbi:tigger transposable element-derived protein 6-like [Ruditapes philippinarum]|uniref:tigger transposable element-derived protein 6-like n=1 Tax=Ruditapes philippinarum TaxID=129788 RepID=UPI00295BBECB|nr:tigger transposable element-derived protein 6-like [Ruditapes philippinarum]
MTEPPSKRRRVELSLQEKITIVKEYESVPKPPMKSFNYDAKFDKLNELVWQWFCVVRAKNLPVSGPIIQEKAKSFATELGVSDFKASNGWLGKWKGRYSIKEFKISGESAGVKVDDVDGFKARIPEFIGDYDIKDVFNCDETCLYYRALPDKTLSAKGSLTKRSKVSKERITVMFTCSALGEKLKPLVIGKFENPRCFKNVNKKNLGVKYVANKKAWMNSHVFKTWINELNSEMRRQGRRIFLMLDNASSHGKADDYNISNVCVKFLPANTTSHLQPLDQGIIRTFKAHYRRYLLKSLISLMDDSANVTELCKNVNLMDAISWTLKAWNDIKKETIMKCFRSVGFGNDESTTGQSMDDEDEYEDDNVPLALLVRELSYNMQDFENIDLSLPTEDDSDQWEMNIVESFRTDETIEDDKVLQTLMKLKNFALEKDSDLLDGVLQLQTMMEDKIVKARCSQRQLTMHDFFVKC